MNYCLLLKRVFALAVFIATASVTVFSQEAPGDNIRWIEKLKAPLYQDVDVLKLDASVLIYQSSMLRDETMYGSILMVGGKKMIYRVDLKTNQVIEKDVRVDEKEEKRLINKMFFSNNKIHIISSREDKDNKKYYVYHQSINPDNLESNNDLKKIIDIDYSKWGNVYTGLFSTNVRMTKSRMLISTSVQKKEGFNNEFYIFDLNLVQKSNYSIEELDTKNPLSLFVIDNDDNLYVINNQVQSKDNSVYQVSLYMKGMESPKRKMLHIQDRFPHFTLSVNEKNELVCAGLCYKLGKQTAIGAFSCIFPPLLSGEGKVTIQSFSDEFLTKGLEKKEIAKITKELKKNKEINNNFSYNLDSLHFNEDGSFSFVTEKRKIKRKVTRSQSGSSTETYYFTFGDIYIFSCNADGSFKWSEKINRNFELRDSYSFAGYHMTHYGDNNEISVIINRSSVKGRSLLSIWGKEPKSFMYTFNDKGEKTIKTLFSDDKLIETMLVRSSKSIDSKRLLFVRLKETILPPASNFYVGELSL